MPTQIRQENNFANPTEDISLKDIILKIVDWLLFLKQKWKLLLIVSFMSAAVSLVYALFQPKIYVGVMTFTLEDDKGGASGIGGALGLASSFGIDLGVSSSGVFNGTNLIELMKSRRLIEQALLTKAESVSAQNITLADLYIQSNKIYIDTIKRFPIGKIRESFSTQQDSLLGELVDKIKKNNLIVAQTDKKTSVYTIQVRSLNQGFSKELVESLANVASEFYIQTKSRKAKINVDILEKRVDSVKNELNYAISGVAAANDNTFNLNPALNIKRTPSTKRQVDVQVNTAILTQLVVNLELARVALRKETPLIQIIDKPIIPLDIEKTSKRQSLMLGFFFGFLVCAGFLVARKLWENIMK